MTHCAISLHKYSLHIGINCVEYSHAGFPGGRMKMYTAAPRKIPASIDPIAMFPGMAAVHAKLVPGVLRIGRRLTINVVDLADASIVYQMHRDESGEGGSTFPDGAVTLHGKKYRISYNGRVWAGTKYVEGAKPVLEAQ